MRKKFRFLTVLAVCVMVLSCFSVTAFAYADIPNRTFRHGGNPARTAARNHSHAGKAEE